MDKTTEEHLRQIRKTAAEIGRDITLMEVCGGHTNTIMRYGLRDILPKNIRLISGPGCPVCVSPQKDIDSMLAIAAEGVPVATYGDMLRVPGSTSTLEEVRAQGAKVYDVYSATEVMVLKEKHQDIVFFGIGFETTTPMTCYLLKKGVSVYSVHKLVPPALKMLADSGAGIDGFIDPGHVSTIIGVKPYRDIRLPQAISGFSCEGILRAIRALCGLIREGRDETVNAYPEVVREEGNPIAQKMMAEHFTVEDSVWRGLGEIPKSGLEVKDTSLDAKKIYPDIISRVKIKENKGCRCGEILLGAANPTQCPLYRKSCTPDNPVGACMVSAEGTCAISYRYGK